ncbi:MAG: PQQ-binding-like beta-propeller repeat protein [Acidobacteria bacterium]|nr:PQQ-binding-like beta-propeller repeat protein [Acidobacteriota bacterium]
MSRRLLAFLVIVLAGCVGRSVPTEGYDTWRVYGGGKDNIRYSRLAQINRDNVKDLQVAWTYDTQDATETSQIQCNPIVVDGLLYGVSPQIRIFAVDAATGEERWTFTPTLDGRRLTGTQRGVVYWSDGAQDSRILFSAEHLLFALDAKTGLPVESFGQGGSIDLREGFERPTESLNVSSRSPGVLYGDLLLMGSVVSEGLPSAPGDIRAFNVRTGERVWSFHTIPHPGEPGYETWPADSWKVAGGANAWPGLTLDEERGLLYAATGSAAFDFYGANRHGDNLYANSLLCLKAETGELVWSFQAVKHDVWDRDFPTPPGLMTLIHNGKRVDAVAQSTKSGHIFVFDRVTGESLFPLEEIEVPASDIPGEMTAKTQVLPTMPEPFARQRLTEDMLTDRTPEAHKAAVERFRKLRSEGQFAPPSREGTIVFPGFDGAAEWGGQAFDPETGLYYVNSNEMAWILRMVEQKQGGSVNGQRLYQRNCAACHLDDLSGTPPDFPPLQHLTLSQTQIAEIVKKGKGRMPGFGHLGDGAVESIARFVKSGVSDPIKAASLSPYDQAFTTDGYNKFLDPEGYPAIKPPWGTLNAYNLDSGELVWKIPFGEFPELAAKGWKNTGTENYGGPVVTAGGLLFIGATNHDRKFHVFDKETGVLLWETTLPAGGRATPAVYEVNGKQFVVIAAGGGKSEVAPSGGKYVAFSLP